MYDAPEKFLAAGAVDGGGITDDYLAGNPSVMGSSVLENRYVVDQLDTTDVAEGRAVFSRELAGYVLEAFSEIDVADVGETAP